MTRPPPRSTLLPYSPLFRPQHRAIVRWRSLSPAKRARILHSQRLGVRAASAQPASEVGSWDAPFQLPVHAIHRSEEHTSEPSHSQISYAVFCLKKKKEKQLH